MSSDDVIDLTVDPKDLLPSVVTNNFLPSEDKSIFHLFQEFHHYPPHPSHYLLPTSFKSMLHQDSIEGFSCESLLKIPPPALQSVFKAYQDAIKESDHPVLSVTVQPQYSHPIVLPTWVFSYWVEIGRAVDIRMQWKVALTWVYRHSTIPQAAEVCQQLLLGLSSLSWSHGAAYTRDITSLLSSTSEESYLSSFHIDHMIGWTRDHYRAQHEPNIANRHIFATVDELGAIIRFYGTAKMKRKGYLWDNLMVIENKIITGEVVSFGGVIHLPLHWVSVVINFQQLKILYGDSLGGQMPKRERQACEQ